MPVWQKKQERRGGIQDVSSYKYLGVMIDATISWTPHIEFICKKIQQCIYFFCRLTSFGARLFLILCLAILQYGLAQQSYLWNLKLNNIIKVKFVRRILVNLWHTPFKQLETRVCSHLLTVSLLTPRTFYTENTNLCHPIGDFESLHLNTTGRRIVLYSLSCCLTKITVLQYLNWEDLMWYV